MAHTTSSNDLSTLMQRAWVMHKQTTATMSESMQRAWDLNDLADRLRGGLMRIKYLKKDGSVREALATLNIGRGWEVYSTFKRTPSPKVFTYWDIEKCDFRCFKVENLIGYCDAE